MDRIARLKMLVGSDITDEILGKANQLKDRAERLGLKHKENSMDKDLMKFMAAYKAWQELEASETAESFDDEALYEEQVDEVIEQKAYDKRMEDMIMKAVKAAFAEMRAADSEMEEEDKMDDKKQKEADPVLVALQQQNEQLATALKQLSDRIAHLEQPIANGSGYRLTDVVNPQQAMKENRGDVGVVSEFALAASPFGGE